MRRPKAVPALLLAACVAGEAAFTAPLRVVGSMRGSSQSLPGAVNMVRPACVVVRMGGNSAGGAKKKITLGPGLFSPDIQLGPEEKWKKPEEKESGQLKAPAVKAEDAKLLVEKSKVEGLFSSVAAQGGSDTVNAAGVVSVLVGLGIQATEESVAGALGEMSEAGTGFVSKDEFTYWYLEGGASKVAVGVASEQPGAKRMSREECESLFQLVDTNGDSTIDMSEFAEFERKMELGWEDDKSAAVFARLDTEGTGALTFDQFYTWYSVTNDLQDGPTLKEATANILDPKKGDEKRIFVRGFPVKAPEPVVARFFARCGGVEHVRMLNLEDGKNSGRMIITFQEEPSVENAMEMHRFRIGKRGHLEVYRVNRGDKEEFKEVKKELHGALIGIRGSVVQNMQKETGAKIFFEASKWREGMILKGTAQERAKAWVMAEEIFAGNLCDTHSVPSKMHGRLIGSGGRVKVSMQEASGAHIVYKKDTEECLVYGTEDARLAAWQLIKDKLWDMQNTKETRYPLESKYHGMLTGKQGITVKALQDSTGAQVRFVTGKKTKEHENGEMVVRGTPQQSERVFAMAKILVRELPTLLSELREEDIALGALRSLPLSAPQVWKLAVQKAVGQAEDELGGMGGGKEGGKEGGKKGGEGDLVML